MFPYSIAGILSLEKAKMEVFLDCKLNSRYPIRLDVVERLLRQLPSTEAYQFMYCTQLPRILEERYCVVTENCTVERLSNIENAYKSYDSAASDVESAEKYEAEIMEACQKEKHYRLQQMPYPLLVWRRRVYGR